jgi:porphobilinogen synthase
MLRETTVTPDDLILPLFVVPGSSVRREIGAMPGVFQESVDSVVQSVERAADVGIPAVLLFGIPETKDATGTAAWADDGIVQRAVHAIKEAHGDRVMVITDVCLCEYTDHGHCGVIHDNDVANDPTCGLLVKEALSHARAGADMVAPSDMMDGRVGTIRRALDEADFEDLPIMSYAAKFCSGFYGPFREAAESTPQFGDRRSYQMDPANGLEALREVALDLEEGADIVMIKPALPYLDVVQRVKAEFECPVAAYQVSGEYSMIKAASANGWIDEPRAVAETMTSIKRAGADMIITYYALDVASSA